MGALLDLSRKSKSPEESEEAAGVGSLRVMTADTIEGRPEDQIQCPNCFAVNHEYGECKTCGTTISPPVEEPEPDNVILKSKPVKQIKSLQKKYNLTNVQLGAGVAVLCLPLFFLMFCRPKAPDAGHVQNKPPAIATTRPSDEKAVKLAVDDAGFSATAPPMYWYEDTSEETSPTPSFSLVSEQANQRIMFLIYNDLAPINSLKDFLPKPPFTPVNRIDSQSAALVDGGDQIIGAGKMKWMLGHYWLVKEGEPKPMGVNIFIASFSAAAEGKSVLVIGRAFDDKKTYNFKTTLFVLDEIASELTAQANKEKLDEADGEFVKEPADIDQPEDGPKEYKLSSDADIDKFLEEAKKVLQEVLELPEGAVKEAKEYEEENNEPKVWKDPGLVVRINREGVVRGLQIIAPSKPSTKTDKLNKALEKAVLKVATFKNPPIVKQPEFEFKMRLKGTEVQLETD